MKDRIEQKDPRYVKHINRKDAKKAGISAPTKIHPKMQQHITAMSPKLYGGGVVVGDKNTPYSNGRVKRKTTQVIYDKKKKRRVIITHKLYNRESK